MERPPCILDHSPDTLRRIADRCVDASHEMPEGEGWFDDLQDAANLLTDWAAIREGDDLVGLDGTRYPLPHMENSTE